MDRLLQAKQAAARAAMQVISGGVVGVGTGSTVACLIEEMAKQPGCVEAAVSSSRATTRLLLEAGIEVVDLNQVGSLPLYIDGADEVDRLGYCLKGGGGAHTQEKILAHAADRFVCLVDRTKWVGRLGRSAPLVLEVLPQARSLIARQCVMLGGRPEWRQGAQTDQGHVLLDVYGLNFDQPLALSATIDQWPGVVAHGLFAKQHAHDVVLASDDEVIWHACN